LGSEPTAGRQSYRANALARCTGSDLFQLVDVSPGGICQRQRHNYMIAAFPVARFDVDSATATYPARRHPPDLDGLEAVQMTFSTGTSRGESGLPSREQEISEIHELGSHLTPPG